jgi:hypothetical protein
MVHGPLSIVRNKKTFIRVRDEGVLRGTTQITVNIRTSL